MSEIFYETHLCPDPELPMLLHYCQIDSEVLPHWHTNIELLYIQSGVVLVTIDNEAVRAEPGDIVVINSNCLHRITPVTATSEYRCLIIEESFISKNHVNYTKIAFENLTTNPKIVDLYRRMMMEFDTEQAHYKIILQGLSLQMIGLLFRELAHQGRADFSGSHAKVELAKLGIHYIDQHYNEAILIDDICHEIGVSKFHFCRSFKEVTTLTINEYLNQFRCLRAQALLLQKTLTVAECASRCGFNDPSYFAKTYRRHFGYLPSEEVERKTTS